MTDIFLAVQQGNVDAVKEIISNSDVDLDSDISYGATALWTASSRGYRDIVEYLVKAGANIETHDTRYFASSLWIASHNGHKDVTEVLVNAGADVNSNGLRERSVLFTAASHGYKNVAAVLLDAGANIDDEDFHQHTPLRAAARSGHLETVKFLIGAGAAVSSKLLPSAVASGNSELVQYLVQQKSSGVFLSIYTRNDRALKIAVRKGFVEILQILLYCQEVLCAGGKVLSNNFRKLQSEAKKCGSISMFRMVMILVAKHCSTGSLGTQKHQFSELLEFLGLDLFYRGFHQLKMNSPTTPPIQKMLTGDLRDVLETPGIGSVECLPEGFAHSVNKECECTVGPMVDRLNSEEKEFWQLSSCGSSAEGTTVGLPNEVDFLCMHSTSPEGFEIADVGHGYRYCYSADVHAGMGQVFKNGSKSFHDQFWRDLALSGRHKVYEHNVVDMPMVQDGGHASTVILTKQYLPTSLQPFLVSIDLVPVLHFSNAWPEDGIQRTWLIDKDTLRARGFSLVAKPPHRKSKLGKSMAEKDRVQLWRFSCSHLETEHITKLDDRVKVAFIASKSLRSPEVCRIFMKDSDNVLQEVSKYITTYFLKTVFLHNVEDFLNTNKTLKHMVFIIYTKLESYLAEGFLLNFWENRVNVLEGLSVEVEKALQVSRLMLSMIRQWCNEFPVTDEGVPSEVEAATVSDVSSDNFAYYVYEFDTMCMNLT